MWSFRKLLGKLSATNPLDSLSNREGQVLKLLANGDSNKAIANSLGISERTVKNHCSNIYRMLKVQNRVQAAKIFWHQQKTFQPEQLRKNMKAIKSIQEFYKRYLPNSVQQVLEASKLLTIQICPECQSRRIHWVQYKTYGYYLCYCCGWSSMTAREIGAAMAKESCQKLKLTL